MYRYSHVRWQPWALVVLGCLAWLLPLPGDSSALVGIGFWVAALCSFSNG